MVETRPRGVEEIAHGREILAHATRLSRIDNGRALWAIARQWLVVIGAAAAAVFSGNPIVYFAAICIVATRQHALTVLFHDATHCRLLSNRRANDLIGNICCGLPGGMVIGRYRVEHLAHHRAPNTDRDPYWLIFKSNPRNWHWPKRLSDAIRVLVRDAAGLNTPTTMKEFSDSFPWKNHFSQATDPLPLTLSDRVTAYAFFVTVAVLLTETRLWLEFLVLWVLPSCTIAQLFYRLRGIAEHFALPDETGTDATRHIEGTWIERLVIAPLNINCHLAHHLFPGIPYYNLPEMTEILFANPEFAARAHRSSGYFTRDGVIRTELMLPFAS